jgi:CRISPR-associated protein (TIGR02584 family)
MPASRPTQSAARRTVLVAVTGMSPAILTETVWALAHEQPAIIPAEVIAITTLRGAEDLQRELLQPCKEFRGHTVWQALRDAILGPARAGRDLRLLLGNPVVITAPDPATGGTRPLEDIRTAADNAAAAEIILAQVRRVTTDPETRLIASLAGGRKTMGALLHAAVSLAGRRGDRLTHVLVNEPFDDSSLKPRFYFPGQPGPALYRLVGPDGARTTLRGRTACIHLADVPVATLGEIVQQRHGHTPASFASLMRAAEELVEDFDSPIELTLDPDHSTARLDGEPVPLTGLDRPFFAFLADRAINHQPPLPDHSAAAAAFNPFLRAWSEAHPDVSLDFSGTDWRRKEIETDDIRKRLNSLRTRLRGARLARLIPLLLPVRGPVGFPPRRIKR